LLLTVSAAAIFSLLCHTIVKKFLKESNCVDVIGYFQFDSSFGYNCYHASSSTYLISVKSMSGSDAGDVDTFRLRFLREGYGSNQEVKNGAPEGIIKMLDRSVGNGFLVVPSSGSDYSLLTYNYTSSEVYERIEVYPVVENKVCGKSDSVKIGVCG